MNPGWRNVTRRPGRVATTALAFVLAVVVIILIQGMSDGMFRTYSGLVRNTPVDLWVTLRGAGSVVNASGVIPPSVTDQLRRMDQVAAAEPLLALPQIADVGERKFPIVIYGYDRKTGWGGPWRLTEGRHVDGPGELVLDAAFARRNGLGLGSRFPLFGSDFTIVGLSAETSSMMSFAAFADREEIGRLALAPEGTATFVLVKLAPGAAVGAIAERLGSEYSVRKPPEMQQTVEKTLDRIMGAPMGLLTGVAFLVGLAVITLTTYTGVLERRQEYGVMRALGMSGGRILLVLLTEVTASALAGLTLGITVAAGLAAVLAQVLPAYPVVITAAGLFEIAFMGLAMALLAALVPLWRISRVDPASVFRA